MRAVHCNKNVMFYQKILVMIVRKRCEATTASSAKLKTGPASTFFLEIVE